HEIAGMPVLQRDADLAVHLEAADAGPVARAWIDHYERPLFGIRRRMAGRRLDAHQRVIGRALEAAAGDHHLALEREHRRLARALVLEITVAALAQHVPEEDGALAGVDPVFEERRRIHVSVLFQAMMFTPPST